MTFGVEKCRPAWTRLLPAPARRLPRRDPRPPLPLRSPEGVFFFFFSLQSLGRFHDDTSPYPSPISGGTLDLRLSMLRPRRRKAEQNVATAVRLLRVRRIIVICKVVSVSCI